MVKKQQEKTTLYPVQSAPELFFYKMFQHLGWIKRYDIKPQYKLRDLGMRVDFYFRKLNLIVEVDSQSHSIEEIQKEDRERDIILLKNGYKVLRIFWPSFVQAPRFYIEKLVHHILYNYDKPLAIFKDTSKKKRRKRKIRYG